MTLYNLLAFPLYALTKLFFPIFKHELDSDKYTATSKDHETYPCMYES